MPQTIRRTPAMVVFEFEIRVWSVQKHTVQGQAGTPTDLFFAFALRQSKLIAIHKE